MHFRLGADKTVFSSSCALNVLQPQRVLQPFSSAHRLPTAIQRGLCLVSFRGFLGGAAGEEHTSGQCQLLNTLWETAVVQSPSQAELPNPFCAYTSKPIHTHAPANLLACLPTCHFTPEVSRRCSDIMKKSSELTCIKTKTYCLHCVHPI